MRTIKSLLLIVALIFSSVLVASTNVEEKKSKSDVITEEIGKLLKNPSFSLEEDALANVTLAINKDNEIVVLSVDSDKNYLVNFIKSRLNYSKLPASFKADEKTFIVPVRIVPGE